MRNLLIFVLLIAALAVGGYYGSPYYTVWRLTQAAKSFDAHEVAAAVELPAVRANLSPALALKLRAAVSTEQSQPHSILDRIGMAIAPFLHAKPEDVLVTPDDIAVMLKTSAPPRYANPFARGRPADSAYPGEPYVLNEGYAENDLDQFSAAVGNRLKPGAEVRLKLLRFGFLTWKVTALDLDHNAPIKGDAVDAKHQANANGTD